MYKDLTEEIRPKLANHMRRQSKRTERHHSEASCAEHGPTCTNRMLVANVETSGVKGVKCNEILGP